MKTVTSVSLDSENKEYIDKNKIELSSLINDLITKQRLAKPLKTDCEGSPEVKESGKRCRKCDENPIDIWEENFDTGICNACKKREYKHGGWSRR